jgi:hypothetical protein
VVKKEHGTNGGLNPKQSRRWPCFFLSFALLLFAATQAQAQVPDPAGDHESGADVTLVRSRARFSQGIQFTRILVTYAQVPEPPLVGYVFIDIDQNPETGDSSLTAVPGIEAVARYALTFTGNELAILTGRGRVSLSPKFVTIDENVLEFGIPQEEIGDDNEFFDFFLVTDVGNDGDSIFDRVPDAGVIDYSSGRGILKVPRPGNSAIDFSMKDAAADPAFPDLAELQIKVVRLPDLAGDRLHVRLKYHHSLEGSFPPNARIQGDVWLDVDKRLMTGFANAGESPPSFGADFAIRFTVDPRRGLSADLLSFRSRTPGRSAPQAVEFGLGELNDCYARRSGNELIFEVPLALLGFSSGEALARVTCRSTTDGALDAAPDEGAVDTLSNQVQLPMNCHTAKTLWSDPDDPLVGDKNDELLSVAGCFSMGNQQNGDLLILQIEYALVQAIADSAVTQIYLDVDQNPATGQMVANADTTIGADFVLSFSMSRGSISNSPVIELRLIQGTARPLIYNQLITAKLGAQGSATISLPLELLNRDDGNLNVLVETSGGDMRQDIAPDRGVIQIRRP